jgi:hypothetical protein
MTDLGLKNSIPKDKIKNDDSWVKIVFIRHC